MKIPKPAQDLLKPLAKKADALGLSLYVVGGPVRDWMLGRSTYDLDLMVEGDPTPLAQEAARLLHGKVEAFGQFGTLRIMNSSKFRVDFATSRTEIYTSPAALPTVKPAPITQDLKRRDFTVNAMALAVNGPHKGELIDPFFGADDLKKKVLRLLHPKSLQDDPTRAFRAARYACRMDLKPDADLTSQAKAAVADGHAQKLSPHRLTQELLKILGEPQVDCILALLKKWGYLGLLDAKLKAPPKNLTVPEDRLGAMALQLKAGGAAFINRLALDRRLSGDLHELLKLVAEKRAPRDEIPASAKRVLWCLYPDLPPCALAPLHLAGDDIKAAGLPPGPLFKQILDEAAALQWKGTLRTRKQALKWLAQRVPVASGF